MSQTSSERRRFPVPLRWLHAGGDLSRHNHANQPADRPLIRPARPPRCPLRFQAPSTPIQVAWRQLRAHHHGRRENQIPIALAAQPAPNFPRLRALALFGRRPPECEAPLVIPASKNLHRSRPSKTAASRSRPVQCRPSFRLLAVRVLPAGKHQVAPLVMHPERQHAKETEATQLLALRRIRRPIVSAARSADSGSADGSVSMRPAQRSRSATLTSSSSRPARCAATLNQRQPSARLTSRARTGLTRQRPAFIRHFSSIAIEPNRAWKRWPVTLSRALIVDE